MPIAPPIALKVTASIKNCTRMSAARAPTAMRMPISRVRSVTLTSMMFMMPMPPTIKRHRRDAREQKAHRPGRVRNALHQVRLCAHGEVGFLAAMPGDQQFGDFRLRLVDALVVGGPCQNVVHKRAGRDPVHVAGIGNDHNIILVLAEKIEALGREHADDLKRNVPDAQGFAQRIFAGKQLVHHGLADDGGFGQAAHILRR